LTQKRPKESNQKKGACKTHQLQLKTFGHHMGLTNVGQHKQKQGGRPKGQAGALGWKGMPYKPLKIGQKKNGVREGAYTPGVCPLPHHERGRGIRGNRGGKKLGRSGSWSWALGPDQKRIHCASTGWNQVDRTRSYKGRRGGGGKLKK